MALVEQEKKGGRCSRKEQEERIMQVYHLHFEENKPAVKIASDAGARSTPSFIVISQEGQAEMITGAQPYGAFKTLIDEMTR